MGTRQKSKERSTVQSQETTTPTYQAYANPIVESMYPSMQSAYQTTMENYGDPGFNPYQQQLWSMIGNQAIGQFGTQGPYAQAARQYIQPTLGQGYMDTLNPYYSQQQKYIEAAMPQQQKQFMQELKRQFGPAWGTQGQALAGASDAYGNFMANQYGQLANLEAQKAQAAQQGIQYTGQMTPTYANMLNPFTWGQQAIGWAGQPEQATSEAMQAQQELATGWINPLTQLATLGYTFPQSTTTVGGQQAAGKSSGKSAGISCCFIMNEAGDFTNAVRRARGIRYANDIEVADGYRKMAKWLVPKMQENPAVRFFVKWAMTHPIAKVAEVRKVDKHHPALYPIGLFWEFVWRIYGLAGTDKFRFNYIIKRLARFYRI